MLLIIIFCAASLRAQESDKNLKTYLSNLNNKQVFFNDGTPPAIISEVTNEYFIAKVHNSYSILIPFHSISKIEIIGEKDKIITFYLMYHKENISR